MQPPSRKIGRLASEGLDEDLHAFPETQDVDGEIPST
jgi:hypothetical protein